MFVYTKKIESVKYEIMKNKKKKCVLVQSEEKHLEVK